ncbi:RNA polymerase sigma-70 factor (ECF subfamily) [Paenibacillus phyllosphaerae]|uniref:RNA polymerase sigma-70 factor (ECF subfamily) n=1 Tax=Paenibacillus phyllosphaerae TaxID=274593 RepID=A0A7W5FPX2_9BACL|nr:sigma-70 family RNA polymerase sigma factor [Paenibacillus phyllosphaerae]MBB3112871.1 RNA polymerase sigma-70 factor (ECF subfamily) [Paenibacillus phyllosphaerae]
MTEIHLNNSSASSISETNLVVAATGGDMEAFAELVRIYTNAVCAIAYDLLRDYHLAQDIAQETFVKAHRNLTSLRHPEKFGSWLYAIALRQSIDHKRSIARKIQMQEELGQLALREERRYAEDGMIRHEMSLDVKQALEQLDQTSRTILLSYYVSEIKMPEIARMLNLSVAAVESRMRRSRNLLKERHLSDWAAYFRRHEATDKLVGPVMERLVKQAGQFYLPVSNRARSKEWFVRVLGLSLDHNGHVMLPSGHCLFLIEVSEAVLQERSSSKNTGLVFMIDDADHFRQAMEEQGVPTFRETIQGTGQVQILFYDPDGNRYGACSLT